MKHSLKLYFLQKKLGQVVSKIPAKKIQFVNIKYPNASSLIKTRQQG